MATKVLGKPDSAPVPDRGRQSTTVGLAPAPQQAAGPKFCEICAKDLPSDAEFCPVCGSPAKPLPAVVTATGLGATSAPSAPVEPAPPAPITPQQRNPVPPSRPVPARPRGMTRMEQARDKLEEQVRRDGWGLIILVVALCLAALIGAIVWVVSSHRSPPPPAPVSNIRIDVR